MSSPSFPPNSLAPDRAHSDNFIDSSRGEIRLSLDQRGLRISLVQLTQQCKLSSIMYQVRTSRRTELLRQSPGASLGTQPLNPRASEIHKHTTAREYIPVSAMRFRLAARVSSVRLSSPKTCTRQKTLSPIAWTDGKPEHLGREITNSGPAIYQQQDNCVLACYSSLPALSRAVSTWYSL